MNVKETCGFCGRCFRIVSRETGGFVLSCSDFLCASCFQAAEAASPGSSTLHCPACNKPGVKSQDINAPNPDEEVTNNLSDVVSTVEKLKNAANFQLKHYKTTIKRMHNTILQLSKENAHYKRYDLLCNYSELL